MYDRTNPFYPVNQNRLVFRTQPGALVIPAGKTVRLPESLPTGIPVASFYTIRIYARCRPTGTVPVTIYIHVLDNEEEELIFLLDSFTIEPMGETVTRTYDVPGRALVAYAQAAAGTGSTAIDFGVIGYGPRPCFMGGGMHGTSPRPYDAPLTLKEL